MTAFRCAVYRAKIDALGEARMIVCRAWMETARNYHLGPELTPAEELANNILNALADEMYRLDADKLEAETP